VREVIKLIKMKYLVVIEQGPTSFGAYVPDLPGCVAVAKTRRGVRRLIREAIQLHVEDMAQSRLSHPQTNRCQRIRGTSIGLTFGVSSA
jgi:predicted RNase H-like HicB family nuclease